MRSLVLCVCALVLTGTIAYGQSYTMNMHLKTGLIVAVPLDSVRHIFFPQATGVQDQASGDFAPTAFRVLQNYPNPFNPSTTIVYEIATSADVIVSVFDIRGSLIRDLVNEPQITGRHQVVWDGTDNARAPVASGVYLSVVRCAGQVLSRKMILMK